MDARDFNNIETRTVIKLFLFLQGKTPKEIHDILTETLACFLPGRAKNLSSPCINQKAVTLINKGRGTGSIEAFIIMALKSRISQAGISRTFALLRL